MPGKITEYNPYIRNKLLEGYTVSEALDKWKKYKKTKKGSRSSRKRVFKEVSKTIKTNKTKKKVGSRTKRKASRK